MGFRVIGFDLNGYKLYGLYESTQYIILDWGFIAGNIDEETVKKTKFKDKMLKEEILKGCDPLSFFSCQYEKDTEKVASHSVVEFELQGIKIAENVESEKEAKKLGKLIKYNPTLKLAYYRPKSVT